MKTKDKAKARAFIGYARDTEGMEFVASSKGDGEWTVRPAPGTNYAPACIDAVKAGFESMWRAYA